MPDDIRSPNLYDQDFYAWTVAQAEALRAMHDVLARSKHDPTQLSNLLGRLDWDNLEEEIRSLGQSDRRELASRIALIIEHLAKLRHSTARAPRSGWTETVGRSRLELQELLRASPSLRPELPEVVVRVSAAAVRIAERSLTRYGELALPTRLPTNYTAGQVLDDWWPEEPAPAEKVSATRRRRSKID